MASRYVSNRGQAAEFIESDDDGLDDFAVSDHETAEDDIPLLFDELRLSYDTESINDIQRISEETDAERDAQAAFEDAFNSLNEANADENKSCASCSKEVQVSNVSSFSRGQHISMPGQKLRKYDKYTHRLTHRYKHHAIIQGIRRTAGTRVEMDLIHFYKDDRNKIRICQSLKTFDLKHDEIYFIEYTYPRYSAEEIVRRAESMLPENGEGHRDFGSYNPGTNNCEHFATWCVVGEGESFQAQSFRQKIAMKVQQLLGEGSKIAKMILRILYISSDEIAAGLTKAVNVPEFVLGGTAALYLIYCIVMTVLHIKDYRKGQMCWSCLKGKLQDLWITFGVFGATSVITFIVFNFALPLMTPAVGIPLLIILVLLSVALQWSVPKIRKALKSPFAVDKNEIKRVSDVGIGDVVSLKYYGLEHVLVVTEVHEENEGKGRIRGVHYGLPSLFGTREVMEDYFDVDLPQSKVKLFDCSHLLTYTPEMVVMQARRRLGEKKWSMISNRSDHFCFWAKVKQRPRGICEDWDNEELEAPVSRDLSSLLIGEKEVHLVDDLQLGDVVRFKTSGILIGKKNLDDGRGRKFEIKMIIYDSRWYGRMKTFTVDLSEDRLFIELYHPAHCHPMAVRVERAKRMKDIKGSWWTDKGFIEDCIMLNP